MSAHDPSPGLEAIALIREAREEAKNLHRAAGEVIDALEDPNADTTRIELAKKRAQEALDANGVDLDARLRELKEYLTSNAELRNHLGDTETRMRNLWDRAYREWVERNRDLSAFTAVQTFLYDFVLEAAYVTVPPRLNENLSTLRIGGASNFHGEFEDEVLNEEQSSKILDWIYLHPRAVFGVIDRKRGIVYKASSSRITRAVSVFSVVVVAAMMVAAPLARGWLDLEDEIAPELKNNVAVTRAVAWGLAGALIHWFVGTMKEIQRANKEGADPPTLGNWVLWVHVRYLSIWFASIGVLVAVVLTAHLTRDTDLVTMMAVGYSADSILDLALPKMTSLMNKRTEVVTKALA